jgi:predicted RNA binding protein YcfA (HicA-like mRNA interferase family)
MSSRQKRHERIRNNPANIRFAEIEPWLRDFGFTLERMSGSHHVFRHSVIKVKLNFQPDKSGMAKPYQVRQALKIIEELP